MSWIASLIVALVVVVSIPVSAPALDVGEKAPLFEAPSTQGTIALADYLGKKHVVLAFYFADFTPVWKSELLAFQKDIGKFEELDAQVLGISFDDLETHKKFTEDFSITFPLIPDDDGGIKKLYALGRLTYLIDKQGIIRYIQKGVPKNDNFLRELQRLRKGI